MPEADASDPAPPATGTAGGFPPPAANFRAAGSPVRDAEATSCIRTEDGTVLDRRTGRAVSAASRDAAEAKLDRRK